MGKAAPGATRGRSAPGPRARSTGLAGGANREGVIAATEMAAGSARRSS